jgi:hypothetical protein
VVIFGGWLVGYTYFKTKTTHTHTNQSLTRRDEHVGLDWPLLGFRQLGHGLGKVHVLGKVVEDVVETLAALWVMVVVGVAVFCW